MDPGALCRCLVCKHNRYHLVWGLYTVVWETVHTNPNPIPNPNRLACLSVVLVRSPILNECRKDNNLVYMHPPFGIGNHVLGMLFSVNLQTG